MKNKKKHFLFFFKEFNALMENYALKVNSSTLLPSNENFILTDPKQLEELKGLYYFLYNAKDFLTLRQNICWARIHVQPQMFIYALTQNLMKREDFKDLNLPKIYEIWPQHFFNDKDIRTIKHFNYAQWTMQEMHRNREALYSESIRSVCKTGQWWCNAMFSYQIYLEKRGNLWPKNVYGNFRNSSKRLQALEEVSLFWLPVDFTREVAAAKELSLRADAYLIEDKAWNSYWYYINMGLWLNERGENDLYGKSLRDWWFWNLQQIVSRYKMEKPKHTENINLNPFLLDYQGKNYHNLEALTMNQLDKFVKNLFALTEKALYEQSFDLRNGTRLQLNNPYHMEYFLDEHFAFDKILQAFMSAGSKSGSLTVLQNFETMLRSQEFYYYAEQILKLYKSLKSTFEAYQQKDLQSAGITVNDVEISELKTYFEIVDTDVTNLLRSSNSYFEGRLMWFKSLMARQQNLQHEMFSFKFNMTSDKPQAVLVRTFLTLDDMEEPDYFQLDAFVSTLSEGYNIITRESKDFYGFMMHSLTYTELYHLTNLALNEEYEFPFNITLGNCRFPHHLKLPKGIEGMGRAVKLVFVVTPYNFRYHKGFNLECDFSSGILAFDDLPPGFPFDRQIPENLLASDNIFIKKMRIYHDEQVRFR